MTPWQTPPGLVAASPLNLPECSQDWALFKVPPRDAICSQLSHSPPLQTLPEPFCSPEPVFLPPGIPAMADGTWQLQSPQVHQHRGSNNSLEDVTGSSSVTSSLVPRAGNVSASSREAADSTGWWPSLGSTQGAHPSVSSHRLVHPTHLHCGVPGDSCATSTWGRGDVELQGSDALMKPFPLHC